MGARLLVAFLLAAWLAPGAHGAPAPRLLYAADWPGPTEIFAADPSGRAAISQVTSGVPAVPCRSFPSACGYGWPLPSPNGERLLFRAAGSPSYSLTGTPWWLAAADGTAARDLGPIDAPAWSPDSTRLAYLGKGGIHVMRADGHGDHIVDRRGGAPVWSPSGDALAFSTGSSLVVLRRGRERRAAVSVSGRITWSHDGRWLACAVAYATGGGSSVKVAEVTASGLRVRAIGDGASPAWAPNRDTVAYERPDGIFTADPRSGRTSLLVRLHLDPRFPWLSAPFVWSPNGRLIAYVEAGTNVVDVGTHHSRRLAKDAGTTIAWSPDGGSLAYLISSTDSNEDSAILGDLRLVTLTGHVRTVAATDAAWGGQITSFAWATPPASVHYRTPDPADGVYAAGPVQWLAGDGLSLTWAACKQFWTWTAGQPAASRIDSETGPTCTAQYSRGYDFGFAVAGDRLVWGEKGWGLSYQWTVSQRSLSGGSTPVQVGSGYGTLGGAPTVGLGTFAGAGSLIVLSSWEMGFRANSTRSVKSETISRVEPDGSLTPISSSPGPYVVMDVSDGGRIVAGGDNETVVLDSNGRQLLAVPVSPLAAQFDGSYLVVVTRGALRDYAFPSGALLHVWPLPDVPTGRPCSDYGDPTCPEAPRLVLHDAANGLAAYVLDGSVHVLRLADGSDISVADGNAAVFFAWGLAYAQGARIHVMSWGRLPSG